MSISTNLREFSLQLHLLKSFTPEIVGRIAKYAVFDIQRQLITDPRQGGLGTPRDTARAASSWFASKDVPSAAVVGAHETPTIDAALNSVQAISFSQPYANYYITNNVPYIVFLNDGNSKQAPPNFIEKAVANTNNRMNTQWPVVMQKRTP